MRYDDVFRVAAEEPDQVGYARVTDRKPGFSVLPDEAFRSDEAALCYNKIQTSEQTVKARLDPDEI